jgi:hypothetical protein
VNEMIMSLVYRARWDERFKQAMLENPEEALAEYRYHLTDEERAAVIRFHAEVIGLSDDELDERLAGLADPITGMYPQGP